MTIDISALPGLTSARFESAKKQAESTILDKVKEPDRDLYNVQAFSNLPQPLVYAVIGLLVLVALAAFWVSAGKQIAATALVLEPVGASYDHLSLFWSNVGIVLLLALGEAGTILFMLSSSVLSGESSPVRIGDRTIQVNVRAIVFRTFAVICASIAISANITITAMHETLGASVFAWIITLAPPITVLAIGLVIETLILATLKARAEQKKLYDAVLEDYLKVKHDPTLHPEWKPTFYRCIYEEMIRLKAGREAIVPLVEMDRNVIPALVQRELIAHSTWEAMSIEIPSLRPTQPLSSLTAGEAEG